eukprot:15002573-Alexandrium_andersonii.AAC.1
MGPQFAPLLGWGRKPPAHRRRPMALYPQTAGLCSSAVFSLATKRFSRRKEIEVGGLAPAFAGPSTSDHWAPSWASLTSAHRTLGSALLPLRPSDARTRGPARPR